MATSALSSRTLITDMNIKTLALLPALAEYSAETLLLYSQLPEVI